MQNDVKVKSTYKFSSGSGSNSPKDAEQIVPKTTKQGLKSNSNSSDNGSYNSKSSQIKNVTKAIDKIAGP